MTVDFTRFFCFRIGALARRLARDLNSLYAQHGITVGQSFVLFYLLQNDGSAVKDIASNLQLDSPAITGFVDRLYKDGLVERKEDPGDRRSLQIYLTALGRELAGKLYPIAKEFQQNLKEMITPEELKALERALDVLERKV